MRGIKRYFLVLLALTALSANSASAQQPQAVPQPDEMGTLYLSGGQELAAKTPRLLTKNAQIAAYLCAPTGTRIAYYANRIENGQVVKLIGVVTTQSGDDTVYERAVEPSGPLQQPGLVLLEPQFLSGWSDDAAYFAFSDMKFSNAGSDPRPFGEVNCIDLVRGDVQTAPIPLDQMAPAGADGQKIPLQNEIIRSSLWAPGARLLAFTVRVEYGADIPHRWGLFLYDPDKQSTWLAAVYENQKGETRDPVLEGWQDRDHLIYRSPTERFVYDLGSGKSQPAPPTARVVRAPSTANAPVTWFPAGNAKVFVNETVGALQDQPASTSKAAALTLKRSGGPLKPQTLQLDAYLPSSGLAAGPQFLRGNGFDQGGVYHVVYLSDGDLKEVDLVTRGATPEEKLAAGDKLTCAEEIPIAMGDAKQMGLGILMYAQDHNLTFPAGDGFHDEIYPYLKSDSSFTSPNGAPFHYLAPADPKLADIEVPATTPLGEFVLPCKKIVLLADGHVISEDIAPAGP